MGVLRYGTSSWSEKTWVGPFYPPGTVPGDYLGHYATQFSTVEADVTYYRIPDHKLVAGWHLKTPEGFVMAAKFPRSIVHGGADATPNPDTLLQPDRVGGDTEEFLGAMRGLGDKCGPLVLQLPYFNRSVFPDQRAFLGRLDAFLGTLPNGFRYAVEVRNKGWLNRALLDLLRRHRAALVLVDLAYMPHPDQLALDLVTTDFLYVRLIGDRKAVEERTRTFDRIVIDHTRRLERWARLLERLVEKVPIGYVYANNHYAGHGPATIRQLADLLPAAVVRSAPTRP